MKKRLPIWLAVAAALGAVIGAALMTLKVIPGGPFSPTSMTSPPLAFRQVSWDDLVPKDWDPLKRYRDMNLGALSDAAPGAQEALRDMRAAWDNAPTVAAMDGVAIKLPGYVVPLEESLDGLKEFLLVPYFGACIHTPPPPANQIVHVVTRTPVKGFATMSTVWVSGTLKVGRQGSMMGVSGYQMDASAIEAYAPSRQ